MSPHVLEANYFEINSICLRPVITSTEIRSWLNDSEQRRGDSSKGAINAKSKTQERDSSRSRVDTHGLQNAAVS